MARIVEGRDVPSVYEETTVSRPGAAPAATVVDDGSGFGVGLVAGVLLAIAIAVIAVLWGTGAFHRTTTNNSPGTTVTSTVPGSNDTSGTTGTSGGTTSGGTTSGGTTSGGTTSGGTTSGSSGGGGSSTTP